MLLDRVAQWVMWDGVEMGRRGGKAEPPKELRTHMGRQYLLQVIPGYWSSPAQTFMEKIK